MAVLVTGGAGYIGSHRVLALVDAGQQVVVLDDLSTGFDWAVHPAAHLVQGDIADQALVRWSPNTASIPSRISPDACWSPNRWPIRSAIISPTPSDRGR